MHRVTGANYSSYTDPTSSEVQRINVDQNLPTVPGTSDIAADRNTIQEEICHVIEYAGIEVIGDGNPTQAAALDLANGYIQLREAIFNSAAIKNAALQDNTIQLSKIALPAERTSGVEALYFDCGSIILSKTDVTDEATFTYEGIVCYNSEASTKYSSKGIGFYSGPGNASVKGALFRKCSYSLSGISWSEIDSAGAAYRADTNFETDIPNEVQTSGYGITAAWIKWGDATGGYVAPATVLFGTDESGYLKVTNITIQCYDDAYPPSSAFDLILEFDGLAL